MKARHTPVGASRAPIAPMHRGPQAHSPGAANQWMSDPLHHAPNAALLIDFDNVTMGIRSDLGNELRTLLGSDIIKGKVAVQRAYADWRRYPQYIVPLAESSIDMIMAPAYGSSKKNATDIRLAIDAMELIFTRPEIGTFILLSGDSDFSSLVMKIKEYGKYVIGVGIRESSSDLLVQNCDEYYSYNALAGLLKTGEDETARKWDAWELVTEAVTRMQQNSDVMRSDRLKQVMQDIDSTFDEKNTGYSKFSRFCQEAAHRGLLTVTKLENGQLEVAPPSAAAPKPSRSRRTAAPAAPKAPVAEAADAEAAVAEQDATLEAAPSESAEPAADAAPREAKSRRGRRGGRGRKRGGAASDAAPMPMDAAEAGSTVSAESAETAELVDDAPPPPPPAPAARAEVDSSIGVSGLRLTRDEAMNLIRAAVAQATSDDDSVTDEAVRRAAFTILGRDSESLSSRNFARILRDAHDHDIIDLRRRGDTFEVARAAEVASVADQLAVKEEEARAAEPQAPAAPPAPRGMGARSAPARGRSRGGGRSAPPKELLMVGVVDDTAKPEQGTN